MDGPPLTTVIRGASPQRALQTRADLPYGGTPRGTAYALITARGRVDLPERDQTRLPLLTPTTIGVARPVRAGHPVPDRLRAVPTDPLL